jgi:hypothetical protein
VDLIQVISTLASSRGTSIGTPGAQIGIIQTETALPCLVNTLNPYFFEKLELGTFWSFWLTIQNTANRHVSNAFDLIGAFILFSLVRAAPRPPTQPRPFFWGGEVPKKRKSPLAPALALGHVCVGMGDVGVGEVAACWER